MPMHQQPIDLDLGLRRDLRWCSFRRRIVMLAASLACIEFFGLPALRIAGVEGRGQVRYLSIQGAYAVPADRPRPLIVMEKLPRSLLEYAGDALDAARTGRT